MLILTCGCRGGLFLSTASTTLGLEVLALLHEEVGPVLVDGLLKERGELSIIALTRPLLNRSLSRNLNHGLCKLLHLHLNDQLLEMTLSAIILLLND